MDENFNKGLCNERHHNIDKLFARDDERIKEQEKTQQELSRAIIQITELLKQQTKQVDMFATKLDMLSQKPGVWFERIISGILAAVIAGVVSIVFAKLNGV